MSHIGQIDSAMEHIRRVARVDVTALKAAVRDNAAMFKDYTFRQDMKPGPHTETETIFVRMPRWCDTTNILWGFDLQDCEAFRVPAFAEVLRAIEAIIGGPTQRAMIIKLKPGGKIGRHADEGTYADQTERFHLPIQTNHGAWLKSGDEVRHLREGWLYWFDKHIEHEGENAGNEDRIHLVVDFAKPWPAGLTFQRQMFRDLIPELPPLFEAHWKEIALHQDRIKLSPDYERYLELEKQGALHIMAARDNGVLVGYTFFLTLQSLHYKEVKLADDDMFWLDPRYRTGGKGLGFFSTPGARLITESEKMLKRQGVHKVVMRTKLHKDLDVFFKRLGYAPIERTYAKLL